MTKSEREWLEMVKKNPKVYKIVVDNDSIWVDNEHLEMTAFEFNSYGQEFIIDLLNELGYKAEGC